MWQVVSRLAITALCLWWMSGICQAATFKGTVTDSISGIGVGGVTVNVKGTTTQTTTNGLGTFTLKYNPVSVQVWAAATDQHGIRFLPEQRLITWENMAFEKVQLFTVQGQALDMYQPAAGVGAYRIPQLGSGVYLMTFSSGTAQINCRLVMAGQSPILGIGRSVTDNGQPKPAAPAVGIVTLVFSRSNYQGREIDKSMTDTVVATKLWPSGNFPDSTTAGCPVGIALTTKAGRTITTNNTVIQGENITSALVLDGQNDTVRNCRIKSYFAKGTAANGTGVVTVHGSAVIEHCTLDGQLGTHAGVWYQGTSVKIRNCEIINVNDGIFTWDADNFVIEDNYLHNLTTESSNGHIDGFQTEGGSHGIIHHNTITISQDQNACVAIWNSRRNSDDILVDSNYLAGTGYVVYVEDYDPTEASPAGGYSVTNIRLIDNMFSRRYYWCVGYYGVWYPRGNPSDAWNRSGNLVIEAAVNVDNGQPPGCF